MAFIKQRGKSDCGVAALAMLCGVTYEWAEQAIPWRRRGVAGGTTTKQLRDGAERLGFEGRGTEQGHLKRMPPFEIPLLPSPRWHLIPDNSLVKVPNPLAFGWHWVVFKKGKIYDPAHGVFRPGQGNYYAIPSSYMQFVPLGTEDCPECGTPTEAQHSGIKCPECGWVSCL